MDHFTSTENAQPWWADVAHLRDDAGQATASSSTTTSARREQAPVAPRQRRTAEPERPARSHARPRNASVARGRRPEPARSASDSGRSASDWFTQEARTASRRQEPRAKQRPPAPTRPARPRATLVDVAPDHAMLARPIAVRRAPGERPTVTITGRPDAALPPRIAEPKTVRGRRTREGATSLVASPDRMILWAVALGLLMILASIGTASADAAVLLP